MGTITFLRAQLFFVTYNSRCNDSTECTRAATHVENNKYSIWFFIYLRFPVPENIDEKRKRGKIEAALLDPNTPLSLWQEFAKSDYGLINGNCPTSSLH